jgi:hypothetical protein
VPTPSAVPLHRVRPRRGARAVESGGLENRWACKRPVGSNPTPAADSGMPPAVAPPSWRLVLFRSRPLKTALWWRALARNWRAQAPSRPDASYKRAASLLLCCSNQTSRNCPPKRVRQGTIYPRDRIEPTKCSCGDGQDHDRSRSSGRTSITPPAFNSTTIVRDSRRKKPMIVPDRTA